VSCDSTLIYRTLKLQMTSRQLISRNLSRKTRVPSVSLFLRSAKQALYLRHQFQHRIPLRYASGEQRRTRRCNSLQDTINAMQRGDLQIPWLVERVRIGRMKWGMYIRSLTKDHLTVLLFSMLRTSAAVPSTTLLNIYISFKNYQYRLIIEYIHYYWGYYIRLMFNDH